MKTSDKILLTFAVGAAAGLMIYAMRRRQGNRRLEKVAEEGYETAHDILFPHKDHSEEKLHFGPVLPR